MLSQRNNNILLPICSVLSRNKQDSVPGVWVNNNGIENWKMCGACKTDREFWAIWGSWIARFRYDLWLFPVVIVCLSGTGDELGEDGLKVFFCFCFCVCKGFVRDLTSQSPIPFTLAYFPTLTSTRVVCVFVCVATICLSVYACVSLLLFLTDLFVGE